MIESESGIFRKLEPHLAITIFKESVKLFNVKDNYERKYVFSLRSSSAKIITETSDHLFVCASS